MNRDLFDDDKEEEAKKLARRTDPDTSHDAAASLTHLNVHRATIMRTLGRIGSGTFEEIAKASGAMTDAQVWRRLNELERMGLAVVIGKKPGKSGRDQRIWSRAR